jgi:hypothetical protein
MIGFQAAGQSYDAKQAHPRQDDACTSHSTFVCLPVLHATTFAEKRHGLAQNASISFG